MAPLSCCSMEGIPVHRWTWSIALLMSKYNKRAAHGRLFAVLTTLINRSLFTIADLTLKYNYNRPHSDES